VALFRVAQEALQNAGKHSECKSIHLELVSDSKILRLRLRDDGNGFDRAACQEGLGLISMRERMRAIGGDLRIHSKPGTGTDLQATVTLVKHTPPSAAGTGKVVAFTSLRGTRASGQ
jgi:signal transduction histidine kinase